MKNERASPTMVSRIPKKGETLGSWPIPNREESRFWTMSTMPVINPHLSALDIVCFDLVKWVSSVSNISIYHKVIIQHRADDFPCEYFAVQSIIGGQTVFTSRVLPLDGGIK